LGAVSAPIARPRDNSHMNKFGNPYDIQPKTTNPY
jgi:hypothetical protein